MVMRIYPENFNGTDITYNICIGIIFQTLMCIIIIVLTLVLIEMSIEKDFNNTTY